MAKSRTFSAAIIGIFFSIGKTLIILFLDNSFSGQNFRASLGHNLLLCSSPLVNQQKRVHLKAFHLLSVLGWEAPQPVTHAAIKTNPPPKKNK